MPLLLGRCCGNILYVSIICERFPNVSYVNGHKQLGIMPTNVVVVS